MCDDANARIVPRLTEAAPRSRGARVEYNGGRFTVGVSSSLESVAPPRPSRAWGGTGARGVPRGVAQGLWRGQSSASRQPVEGMCSSPFPGTRTSRHARRAFAALRRKVLRLCSAFGRQNFLSAPPKHTPSTHPPAASKTHVPFHAARYPFVRSVRTLRIYLRRSTKDWEARAE